MNVTLDLSQGQLSKLRNGHGIRISPAMFGSGAEMILDPMTYNNMMKKLNKGKGVVIKMGSNEIEQNKMEGTGLFAGAGNKSGKISRIKKARKWRDFSNDTLRDGIDTAAYGYKAYQKAVNPVTSEVKSWFGGGAEESDEENDEVQGGKISFKGIKKAYNKNVKNTELGRAVRDTAEKGIGRVYDKGQKELGKTKYGKPLSQYMQDKRGSNVHKLTGMTGVGLKLSGEGKMKPAVVRPSHRDVEKYMRGKGMRLSGGACEMCGGSMNDKFIFENIAL